MGPQSSQTLAALILISYHKETGNFETSGLKSKAPRTIWYGSSGALPKTMVETAWDYRTLTGPPLEYVQAGENGNNLSCGDVVAVSGDDEETVGVAEGGDVAGALPGQGVYLGRSARPF